MSIGGFFQKFVQPIPVPWRLPIFMIMSGAGIPFLLRFLIDPILHSGRLRFYELWSAELTTIPLETFGAAPFVVLGLVTRFFLGSHAADQNEKPNLRAGLKTAWIIGLLFEMWIFRPRISGGFNFGIAYFPLYGGVVMGIAFLLGTLCSFLMTNILSSRRLK